MPLNIRDTLSAASWKEIKVTTGAAKNCTGKQMLIKYYRKMGEKSIFMCFVWKDTPKTQTLKQVPL